ncbi:MAG: hypothetical protein Ta2E_06130 [Mycoplasmoidaceae bacterium]|nr:MAG: hypothetical protein Ta2E_06130 [Mycoplasmoidaceae bacterium]
MALKGKVSVHAYKFNGLLYRSWEFPKIVSEENKTVCLDLVGAKILFWKDKEKKYVFSRVNTPTFWYFFEDEWYNLIVSIRYKKCYMYINVASPFIYEEDAIKFVDLDLDYQTQDVENVKWKELDLDELEIHSKQYNYPDKLKKKILAIGEDLKKKIEDKYFNKFYDEKLKNNE